MKSLIQLTLMISAFCSVSAHALSLEDLKQKQMEASISELDKKINENNRAANPVPSIPMGAGMASPFPTPFPNAMGSPVVGEVKEKPKENLPLLVGVFGVGKDLTAEWYVNKVRVVAGKGEQLGAWRVVDVQPTRASLVGKKGRRDITISSVITDSVEAKNDRATATGPVNQGPMAPPVPSFVGQ